MYSLAQSLKTVEKQFKLISCQEFQFLVEEFMFFEYENQSDKFSRQSA